jgi:two-component system LytT family sensor kinase
MRFLCSNEVYMFKTDKNRLEKVGKSIVDQGWIQELLIFVALLILYLINDCITRPSLTGLGMASCSFLILYAHAQLHRFFLLPVLLEKQQALPYIFFSVLLVLVFGVVLFAARNYWPGSYLFNMVSHTTYWVATASCAVSLLAMIALFLLLGFYQQQKKNSSSQLCMNNLELGLLRSQLNPHFLFNTFNNLYGISLHEPSRLPDLIMQVSQLMRYQLENICQQYVPLKEELGFIESYMALEEERVAPRCDIQYEYINDKPDSNYYIAPMMLLPFIENAFKHGANSIEACFVHILVEVKKKKLELTVTNSIPAKNCMVAVSTRIGLQNTTQRLNILYPGKHQLSRKVTDKEYCVTLALQLN